ncbi:MAG: DUF1573 domain-containing protein [Sediminibacterium sp.]
MKKEMVTIASFLLLISACQNNQPDPSVDDFRQSADTANFTTLQWTDTLINFGTIQMGDSIKVKFLCYNTGKKPLFLSSVRASCGCTIPSYTESAILPGDSGYVSASFNSNRSHPGEVFKTVYVTSNTPGGDNYVLTFTGKIVQPIQ